jgi:hypothetical protein
LRFAVLVSVVVGLVVARAQTALAWGERGHDLVARVAVRLAARSGDPEWARFLLAKEHMLGHLANVPDVVWRNLGRDVESRNAPTHFVDLELVTAKPTLATLPRDAAGYAAGLADLCKSKAACPDDVGRKPPLALTGSAPLRAAQLAGLARAAFARVASDAGSKGLGAAATADLDEALLDLGLAAHFVGDLAQPLHTTRDYDGWRTAQGGLHGYFEGDVVNALDLGVDAEVLAAAAKHPFAAVVRRLVAVRGAAAAQEPLELADALALDSFGRVPALVALDRKSAWRKASRQEHGLRVPAERRPPEAAAKAFRAFVIERLAMGADALATIWRATYEAGGKPALGAYRSYAYPAAPAFVEPTYAEAATPTDAPPGPAPAAATPTSAAPAP